LYLLSNVTGQPGFAKWNFFQEHDRFLNNYVTYKSLLNTIWWFMANKNAKKNGIRQIHIILDDLSCHFDVIKCYIYSG
jgi:uncharacterized protein YjaG (DUF416 family)